MQSFSESLSISGRCVPPDLLVLCVLGVAAGARSELRRLEDQYRIAVGSYSFIEITIRAPFTCMLRPVYSEASLTSSCCMQEAH